MPSRAADAILNPNIDALFNPFIPRNQARRLPKPVSHFLGYRTEPAKEPPIIVQWLLTIFATIAGLCTVGAVYNYAPGITAWNPPTIVASFGASAVLDYNTIRSPLAQPRNSIIGHTIAAIVGVGIAKAFILAPNFFANHDWVAAAVACALANVAMSMLNSVHPPGGATAIIACTEKSVLLMGWRFPVIVLIASLLMVGVACVFNNLLRQYPVFWWTPEIVGQKLPHRTAKSDEEAARVDEEAEVKPWEKKERTDSGSDHTLTHDNSGNVEFEDELDEIFILPHKIRLPIEMHVTGAELELLKSLQARMRTSKVN